MIRPILACKNPYDTAKKFVQAGWQLDFSQSEESGDPLVGVSLLGNSILLGITEGYVAEKDIQSIGCGLVLYLTIPSDCIYEVHKCHEMFHPSDIKLQSWGDYSFEVCIDKFCFMIASS